MSSSSSDPPADAAALAAQHAELGLPVPRRTRLRFFKRLIARLGRLLIHHQVAYNHAVLDSLAQIRTSVDQLGAVHAAAEMRIGSEIGALRSDLHAIQQATLEAASDGTQLEAQLGAVKARAGLLEGQITDLAKRADEFGVQLERVQHSAQARYSLVDLFLRQLRREFPMKPDPDRLVELPSGDDDFHQAFEDVFRGSFEDITERQRPYLTDLEDRPPTGRVLDVGSGRGEWLQLLSGAGIDSYGVDVNLRAVEACRDRGLDVVHGDALDHLASLPDASLAAVTAFQLVEHLSFDALVDLLDHSARVLQPGGILILETPNSTNILVGSTSFFVDPSHQRPVHPALLEFLLSMRAFEDIDVRFVNPNGESLELADHSDLAKKTVEPMVQRLNALLFGAQDCAVLSRRMSD